MRFVDGFHDSLIFRNPFAVGRLTAPRPTEILIAGCSQRYIGSAGYGLKPDGDHLVGSEVGRFLTQQVD